MASKVSCPAVCRLSNAAYPFASRRASRARSCSGTHTGTGSRAAHPAAGLIRYFRGDHLVVINMQPTGADAQADLCIAKPIGQVLSEDVVLE